jgi:hypothetical protein
MKVEELPDFPALQQLARALWQVGKARGAAILVGAGFSRNASPIHSNTRRLPLWADITEAMRVRLYPDGQTRRDPLRLAEEFKAVLGETVLESLIRDLVRDDEWVPGELHRLLVRLPWTDILTTNWDTLIERAALENLGQTYETVRCIQDIATTRSPRVVKLHGSFPSNRPFILSEEDYRTYPRQCAPFVNLVQQTFLENELCLLGFSGDDPNFLQWSGWVRDQLGVSARRIHLVGVLNLTPAQRRLLESRNVSPIDLTPLVGAGTADPDAAAASLFLKYLLESRPRVPWNWPEKCKAGPATSPLNRTVEQRLKEASETLQEWERQRVTYPGWVICPPHVRTRLRSDTVHEMYELKSILNEMPLGERGRAVFETVWRLGKIPLPIIAQFDDAYRTVVHSNECWQNCQSREFVAVSLLRTARENRDARLFADWLKYFEDHIPTQSETTSSILYERCLWACDELNYRELQKLVEQLEGDDPLWKLRKAGLLCNLGGFRSARDVTSLAIRDLRERLYRDRNSVWVVSRLAWATFLSRCLRAWEAAPDDEPSDESEILRMRFLEMEADPWETLKAVDLQIERDLQTIADRKRGKEAQFKAGTYRDHSSTVRIGSWWPLEPIYAIWRISEITGVPARCDHVRILSIRMVRSEGLTDYKYNGDGDYLRVLRVAEAEPDEIVNRVFGRVQIGGMPTERCENLRRVLSAALEYALEQITRRERWSDDFWSLRAAAYTEIISRLSVRLDDANALALFRKALLYAVDHRWKARELFAPLAHLLEQSFSAIPPRTKGILIDQVFGFPLPDEAHIPSHLTRDWPEPAEWFPESQVVRPKDASQFAARVATLTEKTKDAEADIRSRAARRLATLYLAGALTPEEADRFGEALWARRKSDKDFPCDTLFYSHMFLLLPAPDRNKARDLLMERSHELSSLDALMSIGAASQRRRDRSRGFVLPRDRAVKMLDALLAWKPKVAPSFDLAGVRRENDDCRQAMGAVLADAILPSLSMDDMTTGQIDGCFQLVEQSIAPTATQALPELLRIDPSRSDRVAKDILKAMISIENNRAWAGFNAIYRWMNLTSEGKLPQISGGIVDRVIFTVEARRDPGLQHSLGISRYLLEAQLLGPEDKDRLATALGPIFSATDYSNHEPEGVDPITYTIVRASAVRLADALKKSGVDGTGRGWLEDYASDPMPEVRFALGGEEDGWAARE